MTVLTTAVDNFLDYSAPTFQAARAVGLATRNLDVYRTEKFRLVRVCSFTELRAAVALAGMAMAAYALETCQATFPDAFWGLESDISDLVSLQQAVARADSPQLVEGILAVHHAGQPPALRRWDTYRHLWPKGTAKIAGYQGGVEGLIRLAAGCWLEGRESIDTTEHGISSVFPRAKAAFKHLRTKGATAVHEKRVLEILGALQVTNLLQFLESPPYTA